jgi:CRISPR-associated protein Cmr4
MTKNILYLFTRTPLHVGAGASVGAIDQPIIRERHTGFPVIPGTSLKGTFADLWNEAKNGEIERSADGKWLFGETDANNAAAGALQFSEARLLAFPVRSARGSFAWITCPLILHRAIRDGVIKEKICDLPNLSDEQAYFTANGPLAIDGKVVLEEYTFSHVGNDEAGTVGDALKNLLAGDPVWSEVANRLVILSDGMMSFFAQNACEIAQHVRIDDETGTAAGGALFNQENVPSETLFYAVICAFDERTANQAKSSRRSADEAIKTFQGKDKNGNDDTTKPGVRNGSAFQFGGDASTGLGWCTVKLADPAGQS